MYLIEFLFKKLIRIGVPALFWLAAIAVPVILAQIGAFDFALIDGRCYQPIARCGQDNVSLVAAGAGIVGVLPAIVATWVSVMWDDSGWKRERDNLWHKYHPAPPKEPAQPNIYD